MAWTYLFYLALTFAGTLAFVRVFSISFSKKQWRAIFLSLISTTLVFTLWDAWAVARGHWEFGLSRMVGVIIGNQPLEEISFFAIVPFFGIVLWEIARKFFAQKIVLEKNQEKSK